MLGNKEIMAKNIKKFMKINKIDRNRMSKDLNVSYTTLSDWINAKTYPRIDKIELMANYFSISKSDLVEDSDDIDISNILPVISIPVLSKVSAGLPIYAEQNIVDHTFISKTLVKNGKEYFGLIVSGDSMDKEFKDGDIVIVEYNSPIENGQIGVVQINGYNATVKRVRYNGDNIILLPESNNQKHQPQFYNKNDEIIFVGRVVGMNRNY
ncbi:helix-turn-helix domain-containing protein [Macrococcus armenti]|uniref:helix-turn-helix domain-containing protein n=1 Tax=Macrococcus armenti TaxID=2875764 RepID=UPI001CCF227A|nr:XRE family transcriptional regulator [Macrococcus armenti]UBH14891.1 XRE family transcriptional regulator [Macrococcus armenti]UBH17251.1 XRE family transcriptional regulator [Macrococcus armenti]UBH19516.1 XRE family transcriptional regulator [Macrococcus armenti]